MEFFFVVRAIVDFNDIVLKRFNFIIYISFFKELNPVLYLLHNLFKIV